MAGQERRQRAAGVALLGVGGRTSFWRSGRQTAAAVAAAPSPARLSSSCVSHQSPVPTFCIRTGGRRPAVGHSSSSPKAEEMPKQTARKCTGGGFAPYVLARAKRAAAGLPPHGPTHDAADGPADGDEDDASRDLSVSSAGMEDMKLFSIEELQAKTKEELVQIVVRLQESIQDIIAEEEDEEDFDDSAVGAGGDGQAGDGDEDDIDDDDDDEDFEEGVIGRGSAGGPHDVVELVDDDDDDDEDDLDDDEEEGDAVNGIANGDVSGEGTPAPADTANGESKD